MSQIYKITFVTFGEWIANKNCGIVFAGESQNNIMEVKHGTE